MTSTDTNAMNTKHCIKKNTPIRFSRLRIIKNLVVITCTVVLLFTAYDGISMLQSTMNGKQGIGSASQAVMYVMFAASSLLLPKYSIKKIGCKMTMFVGTAFFLPYIAANAYPTWFTMISSALLLGIGSAILWAAQCTYFNEAAGIYCDLVEDERKDKKHGASKLGGKNLELSVIQNGLHEKLSLKPKSISDGIILTQYREIDSRYSNSESKFSTLETIAENNIFNTLNASALPIQQNKSIVNGNRNDSPLRKTLSVTINNENSNYIESKKEFFNVEDKNLKQCWTESEINLSSQLWGKRHSSSATLDIPATDNELSSANYNAKRASIVSHQSLKNIVIPVPDSTFSTIELITALFFGCFGAMYHVSQVSSNLISYYVLSVNIEDNVTLAANQSCGALYCNFELEDAAAGEIASSTRYLLVGITVSLSGVASLLLLIFLDPLDTRDDDKEKVTFTLKHAMATLNHLKQKEQLFLVPLSVFSGMCQGFYTADFTKSYVQCAWSISYVGLVSVFFGLAGGLSSFIFGCVVKFVGRIPVVLFGVLLHLALDVFLMTWQPSPEYPYIFYLTAALYGVKVGIIWSQLQSFYGLLFKNNEEAAFATYFFCTAMGWTLSFAYSDYLCTYVKIYILMAVSCCGFLGYLLAERSFRERTKS